MAGCLILLCLVAWVVTSCAGHKSHRDDIKLVCGSTGAGGHISTPSQGWTDYRGRCLLFRGDGSDRHIAGHIEWNCGSSKIFVVGGRSGSGVYIDIDPTVFENKLIVPEGFEGFDVQEDADRTEAKCECPTVPGEVTWDSPTGRYFEVDTMPDGDDERD